MSNYRKFKKWAKKMSTRKVRRASHYNTKGNHHHKIFDYWWTLY